MVQHSGRKTMNLEDFGRVRALVSKFIGSGPFLVGWCDRKESG